MNEMIERVARAMADSVAMNYDHNSTIFQHYARAAIEAMREPSADVLKAMEPWSRSTGHHELVWKAGIDAALKPDTSAPSSPASSSVSKS